MWYKYAQNEIWSGIEWSGPLGELTKKYLDEPLIKALGFDKHPNVWALVVDDNETYSAIVQSIFSSIGNRHSDMTERGCFLDLNYANEEEKNNLKGVGDILGVPDLDSYYGISILKKDSIDAALVAHEASHANRYQRAKGTDYTTNKEEIEAEIYEGIVERVFEEDGLPLSTHREDENAAIFSKLLIGQPVSDLSLRNMLIRYVVMYSNNINFDKKYINRLAMQINVFLGSLHGKDKSYRSASNILSKIVIGLMRGEIDPDEMLQDFENVMHSQFFSVLEKDVIKIKEMVFLDEAVSDEIKNMFQDLIQDAHDALEYEDYEMAQRLLNAIDDLYTQILKRKKQEYVPTDINETIDQLDERLMQQNPQPLSPVNYPEHPLIRYKDLETQGLAAA